jgi:hypothetical protein
MLLPDNIHPENTIYFNGAFVLTALKAKGAIDLLELYQNTLKFRQMSFPTFVLCLDWLYLIDAAELKNGMVRLCS